MRATNPVTPAPAPQDESPIHPGGLSEGKPYRKVCRTCPVCLTEVVTKIDRTKGGRPREFHRECHSVHSLMKRLEWFFERTHFDESRQSRRAASMLRRRLWSLANRLNRFGRPAKLPH